MNVKFDTLNVEFDTFYKKENGIRIATLVDSVFEQNQAVNKNKQEICKLTEENLNLKCHAKLHAHCAAEAPLVISIDTQTTDGYEDKPVKKSLVNSPQKDFENQLSNYSTGQPRETGS